MDVISSGITAAFFAIVLGLVRVVEWLVRRKPDNDDKKMAAQSYNGMGKISDKLIEMKGSIDGLGEKIRETVDESREISKELSDVRAVHERLGDKVDNLSSKIDKLEALPRQIERLADAIEGIKKK